MSVKIGLDAGHGLKTSGKETPDGIKEWTLNDKVRDKVVELLKNYDVKFIFTDNDEGNTDESLYSRYVKYINQDVDAFVSIHHNAYTGKWNNATGVEIYVDKNYTSKDMELAEAIYKNLPSYTGLKGRGIKKENWYVINQNKIPAVLVEGGFMDSNIDYKVITSSKGQEGYAKAVAEGLISFLNLKKGSSSSSSSSKYVHNERVGQWQEMMNKTFGLNLAIDNNFGPDCTAKANKYYQYKTKNVDDRKINNYVGWIQKRLKELGFYKGNIDNSFWRQTDQAVRDFQKSRGLEVDGSVGALTAQELLK